MVFECFFGHRRDSFIDNKILIAVEEDNIKILIQFTKDETKLYKEIKNIYSKNDFKDDDKVSIEYFSILEKF